MIKKLMTLLIGVFAFTLAQADLSKAEAYAKNGEIKKAQFELYQISLRAMEGQPKSMCEMGTMYKREAIG